MEREVKIEPDTKMNETHYRSFFFFFFKEPKGKVHSCI